MCPPTAINTDCDGANFFGGGWSDRCPDGHERLERGLDQVNAIGRIGLYVCEKLYHMQPYDGAGGRTTGSCSASRNCALEDVRTYAQAVKLRRIRG
jgi:hypothetical protein